MEKVLGRGFTVYREAPVPRDRDKAELLPCSLYPERETACVIMRQEHSVKS